MQQKREPHLVLRRVVIESLQPEIDGGKYPIKRTVGERVVVEADIHADGHDVLTAVVLYRPDQESAWREAAMQPLVNDRWQGHDRQCALQCYLCRFFRPWDVWRSERILPESRFSEADVCRYDRKRRQ